MSFPKLGGRKNDALAVANYIIENAVDKHDNPKTLMQILKLAYFAQAWMLGLYGRPLFRQEIEAWQYGPVVPEIYQALKHHGSEEICDIIEGIDSSDFDETETKVMDDVLEAYDELSGFELSHLTHWPDSPWFKTRVFRGEGAVIPNRVTKKYYKEKLGQTKVDVN